MSKILLRIGQQFYRTKAVWCQLSRTYVQVYRTGSQWQEEGCGRMSAASGVLYGTANAVYTDGAWSNEQLYRRVLYWRTSSATDSFDLMERDHSQFSTSRISVSARGRHRHFHVDIGAFHQSWRLCTLGSFGDCFVYAVVIDACSFVGLDGEGMEMLVTLRYGRCVCSPMILI
jgi:hypothetical protein